MRAVRIGLAVLALAAIPHILAVATGTESPYDSLLGQTKEQKLFAQAEAEVRKLLTDPDNAQFRNLHPTAVGFVCGEFNTKNDSGGYVGFKKFVWASSAGVIFETASPTAYQVAASACQVKP